MEPQFDKAKGKVKETVGEATDNRDLETEGRLDQAGAEVKSVFHRLREKVSDWVDAFKERSRNK